MVAAAWRHGSLAVLAATLLMPRHAAAEPSPEVSDDPEASLRLSPQATAQLIPQVNAQLSAEGSLPLSPEATAQLIPQVNAHLIPQAPTQLIPQAPTQLILQAPTQLSLPVNEQPIPEATAQLIPQVNAQLIPQVTVPKVGSGLDRVPTASWAMGCAAGIALAMHAVYQTSSDRHRTRMKSCADDCPNYRIDDYEEMRERADVALRLSVFAAASALWLIYNDPQEALERMGQRKLPRQQPGFRVKVKPERRGVWASVVAYF